MFTSVSTQVNFPEIERNILKWWQDEGIMQKYLHRNDASKKRFSFLDGPITANNPMGVHHAWGRTYKDIWQRFYNMRGYRQRFQNGFDCQGLWVEVEVEKELGIRNKKDIENLIPGDRKKSIARFVELCKARVIKYSTMQSEQSIRLGYFMDWGHSYYTMSDENNYMIWHFLKTCHEKGWIYKGKDSVPWCPRCETAISQHEMLTEDYKELTHETVFLKLPVVSKQLSAHAKNIYLLIWTTTPWTIPANVAVGVNTAFTYGIWKEKGNDEAVIIVEKDENGKQVNRLIGKKEIPIAEYIFSKTGKVYEKTGEIKGDGLVGLMYRGPFDDLPVVQAAKTDNPKTFHTVVEASEIVVSTEGTGLLHVAPGAGKEDFDLGKKESLPIISVIMDDAAYVEGMGQYSGKNAKKHPEIILDDLRKLESGKFLLKTMQYLHRYPACWRCKTELVWKVAEEWYIAMDKKESVKGKASGVKNAKTLREQMMETAKMITWHPEFGLERELDWLSNMHDWLISKKNRYWGLALPIFECSRCGSFEVIGSREELESRAVSGWEEFKEHSPHKPYIDDVRIKCSSCREIVSRVDDVGNVWLDAGIVPFSTYVDPDTKKLSYTTDRKYWQDWFPADFITESFPGQFKNWFYSMIAMSTVLEKRNPFKTVLGFASMLGEDGRPMHKSWGNAIEFYEGADKIGVDVMRWMFARQDPEQNLLFGYKKADETRRKFHLLLWNVYNFFITYANFHKWQVNDKSKKQKQPAVLDTWITSRLHQTIRQTTGYLENYDAKNASAAIEEFVTDLSQWYVRRSRDRVGPAARSSEDAHNFLRTLYTVLVTLSELLAPFTPFLAETMYKNLTGNESVHLDDWPEEDEKLIFPTIETEMAVARKIVEIGHSLRKEKQVKIRQPLGKIHIKDPENRLVHPGIIRLVLDELNIKSAHTDKDSKRSAGEQQGDTVSCKESEGYRVCVDFRLDDALVAEGRAREIIRSVQNKRKEAGCAIDERVTVYLPEWPEAYQERIMEETCASRLIHRPGQELSVERSQ